MGSVYRFERKFPIEGSQPPFPVVHFSGRPEAAQYYPVETREQETSRIIDNRLRAIRVWLEAGVAGTQDSVALLWAETLKFVESRRQQAVADYEHGEATRLERIRMALEDLGDWRGRASDSARVYRELGREVPKDVGYYDSSFRYTVPRRRSWN